MRNIIHNKIGAVCDQGEFESTGVHHIASGSTITATGVNGDLFFDHTTDVLWIKVSSGWEYCNIGE